MNINKKIFIFKRKASENTPLIYINQQKEYIKIKGDSFPENAVKFYNVVENWLNEYLKDKNRYLVFDCNLNYFNSSTAKILTNIFYDLENHHEDNTITVNWIVERDNDIALEWGNDFKEDMNHTYFNVIIE